MDRGESLDIEKFSDFIENLAEFDGGLGNLFLDGLIERLIKVSTQRSLLGQTRESFQVLVKCLAL
jgi:hypothetical protein